MYVKRRNDSALLSKAKLLNKSSTKNSILNQNATLEKILVKLKSLMMHAPKNKKDKKLYAHQTAKCSLVSTPKKIYLNTKATANKIHCNIKQVKQEFEKTKLMIPIKKPLYKQLNATQYMHGPLHTKNKENFNLQNKDDALQRLKASHIRRHSDITDVKATDKMETLTGKYKKEIPYIIGQTLGEGAYAVVKKVTSKTNNEVYAAKIYDKVGLKDPQRWKSVKSEIKVMEKLSHPNIVKLIECFDTDTHVYIIMEKINGCDLHNYVKYHTERKLSDARARKIVTQTLLALQYCHKKCITHRDIKLENIIISDEGQVKVIDFGFSTCIPNDKKLKIFCGTPSYMAPEIVQRTEYTGPPVDVWALGVVLYHLLTGVFPYKGKDNKELYSKIQQGIYPMSDDISPKAASLLRNIFHVNAKKRYTVTEILNHPWIKETEEKQRSFLRNTFDDNIPKDASKDANQSKKLAESIDDDILASLMNIGYSKESIAEGLNNKSSEICRIYLNKKGQKVPLNRAIAPSKVPSVLASININNFNKTQSNSRDIDRVNIRVGYNLNKTASHLFKVIKTDNTMEVDHCS